MKAMKETGVLPWDGRNPRHLTRSWKRFSFSSEGTGRSNVEPIRTPLVDQKKMLPEGAPHGS